MGYEREVDPVTAWADLDPARLTRCRSLQALAFRWHELDALTSFRVTMTRSVPGSYRADIAIARCRFVDHRRANVGHRAVGLRNDDQLRTTIGVSSDNAYGLTAPRMKRIEEPSLDWVLEALRRFV